MGGRNWNGAKWWKFDLHTHTPESTDYGKGPNQATLKERTPKEWLLDYMRAEIDCVAITDHNSGAWIDLLRNALKELESERPQSYRPIHLLAGVEISVNGGVHVLGILGADAGTPEIDSLLGAVDFSGAKGESSGVTSKSFTEVVAAIDRAGGIAIPAHVDRENGLFVVQKGNTLEQGLKCDRVFAVEIVDGSATKPQLYLDKKLCWTEVLGSDSHHPSGEKNQRYPGSHFTWVKMGSPSLEGLRLALLDGPLSVLRSDDLSAGDPNQHAPLLVESIEVSEAHYMGRAEPFLLRFNPWLNSIIGGRGTGKSTLLEFVRLALRREDELSAPGLKGLEAEFEKYSQVHSSRGDGGVLTDTTSIRVTYRKDGSRFRLQWSPTGDLDAIEQETEQGWRPTEGDVARRFPVRLYSQKQIFHLAKSPQALLQVVDDAPEVGYQSWHQSWVEEEGRYLSLRAKAREIEARLAELSRLRGELDDVKRKLVLFEEDGYAEILKALQTRRRQQQAIESWEESWSDAAERLRKTAEELVPDPLDDDSLHLESEEDAEVRQLADAARSRLDTLRVSLEQLATQADEILTDWQNTQQTSAWAATVDTAERDYAELSERLSQEGAGDPSEYGEHVQQRQVIERRLKGLGEQRVQIERLRRQADSSLERLLALRRELTDRRRSFLHEILHDSRYIQIEVVPYGDKEDVEAQFRELVQKEDGRFGKDIGNLLGETGRANQASSDLETSLHELKNKVRQMAAGRHDPADLSDARFAGHVAALAPEALDRIDSWFPEDSLDVRYSPTGDGRNFRPIHEGSPGQKTAALLAFLLSYGDEPLILDQPEDDLDNHIIYELIVTQLREVKRRRQIIVVTHNPNIVVNGDAELVVALVARSGQTQKECEGSLQDKKVRETICEVMEGGRDAFEQRYRRIALGGRHV